MKRTTFIFIAGLVLGLFIPIGLFGGGGDGGRGDTQTRSQTRSTRSDKVSRLAELAKEAEKVSRAEWPAFFEKHLNSPSEKKFLAHLWAEGDPDGFWQWLREGKDRLYLESLGPALIDTWVRSDPDAAMDATMQITDKELADNLCRRVIDQTLEIDLAKGIELAARAGDFNRFGWAPRQWISKDPGAAVLALGALPVSSEYRGFLGIALGEWAAKDPAACLTWLKELPQINETFHSQSYYRDGFASAAKADKSAALATAFSITKPEQRSQAMQGLLESGVLTVDEITKVMPNLSIPSLAKIGAEMMRNRNNNTEADLHDSAKILLTLPMSRNAEFAVSSLASDWARVSPNTAWDWAASLPDASMRRKAYSTLARKAPAKAINKLGFSDLSDELFRQWLFEIPKDQREREISRLSRDRAAWAKQVSGKM